MVRMLQQKTLRSYVNFPNSKYLNTELAHRAFTNNNTYLIVYVATHVVLVL